MPRDQLADALDRLSRPHDPRADAMIEEEGDLFANDLVTLICPVDPVGDVVADDGRKPKQAG